MRKLALSGFALAIIALLVPTIAYAQTARIGSLGLSGPLLPLWLAQDKGLFAKQGLATELITFQGGTPTVQALLSGGISFAATSTDTGANARVRGGNVVGIAEWVNSFPYMLVTTKEIDRGEKLKGKKIAISRFGGAAHYAARLSLAKIGLDAEKDTQMLQIGDEAVRLAALRQGFVDATVLTPPTNLTARNLGFNVLVSLVDAGVKYSFDTIFTTRDYAARNRDTVLRFLRGFLSGVAYMKKNNGDSIETLKKWTRSTDRAALEETYRIFGSIIPAKPYGTEEGWKNLLEVLSAADPKARQLETKDMFDYTFLSEIDKSGFIDALYK
jgi:NitT/TauT family transport system substrate-binding protein